MPITKEECPICHRYMTIIKSGVKTDNKNITALEVTYKCVGEGHLLELDKTYDI